MSEICRLEETDGTLSYLSYLKLVVIVNYPNDLKSTKQAMQILQTEYNSFRSDRKNWQFSSLSQTVLDAASKRAGKIYVAGLMAFIIAHLNADGSPASINNASRVASRLINDNDKVVFKIPKSVNWEIKEKRIVEDSQTIKRYFREFRPAAQICAANALIGSDPLQSHPMVKPFPEMMRFISTVLYYQRLFKSWPGTSEWKLWNIYHECASFGESYPPFSPSEEQLEYIRS